MTNLVKAIIAVMREVENIDKKMTVGSGGNAYKGVADKDVKLAIGRAMANNGLVILPIGIDPKTKIDRWVEETSYGPKTRQSVLTEVKTKYLLLHESGESMELQGLGHGVDPQDKAAGKATTYALKNALLYTFLVPTGHIDDTDATHSDSHATPPVHQQAPAPKAKPALVKGSDDWNNVVNWLSGQDGEVTDHTATIAKKFTLSQAIIDALKVAVASAKGANEVPVETLDALASAPDMESLTKIYNDCQDLHANRAFTEAYAKRHRELAKPKGGKS